MNGHYAIPTPWVQCEAHAALRAALGHRELWAPTAMEAILRGYSNGKLGFDEMRAYFENPLRWLPTYEQLLGYCIFRRRLHKALWCVRHPLRATGSVLRGAWRGIVG